MPAQRGRSLLYPKCRRFARACANLRANAHKVKKRDRYRNMKHLEKEGRDGSRFRKASTCWQVMLQMSRLFAQSQHEVREQHRSNRRAHGGCRQKSLAVPYDQQSLANRANVFSLFPSMPELALRPTAKSSFGRSRPYRRRPDRRVGPVQGSGHKAQLQRHSEALRQGQAHRRVVLEGRGRPRALDEQPYRVRREQADRTRFGRASWNEARPRGKGRFLVLLHAPGRAGEPQGHYCGNARLHHHRRPIWAHWKTG